MRKLHLVGLTADREGLVFTARSGSKAGGYLVPIDAKLLDALTEAGSPPPRPPAVDADGGVEAGRVEAAATAPARTESALTPREIQARLRAGRSLEEVAEEAGVGLEWVERFARPIMAEQARVVAMGRNLVYSKPRLGESSQPLAASVAWNLSERSVWLGDDLFDSCWGAYQLHDSVWILRFRYRSRGRQQDALWELDLDTGTLVARNRLASELGYVEKGRRRRDAGDPGDDDASPERVTKRKPPARKAAEKGRAAKAPGAQARAEDATVEPRKARERAVAKPTTRRAPREKAASTPAASRSPSARATSSAPAARSKPSGPPPAADDTGDHDLPELSGPAPKFVPRPMPSDGGAPRRPPRPRRAARPPRAGDADPSAGEVVKLPSPTRPRPARRSR